MPLAHHHGRVQSLVACAPPVPRRGRAEVGVAVSPRRSLRERARDWPVFRRRPTARPQGARQRRPAAQPASSHDSRGARPGGTSTTATQQEPETWLAEQRRRRPRAGRRQRSRWRRHLASQNPFPTSGRQRERSRRSSRRGRKLAPVAGGRGHAACPAARPISTTPRKPRAAQRHRCRWAGLGRGAWRGFAAEISASRRECTARAGRSRPRPTTRAERSTPISPVAPRGSSSSSTPSRTRRARRTSCTCACARSSTATAALVDQRTASPSRPSASLLSSSWPGGARW